MTESKITAAQAQMSCLHSLVAFPSNEFVYAKDIHSNVNAKQLLEDIKEYPIADGLRITPYVNHREGNDSSMALVIKREPVIRIKNRAFKQGFINLLLLTAQLKAKETMESTAYDPINPLFTLPQLFEGRGDFDFTEAAHKTLDKYCELQWQPELTRFMLSNGDVYEVVTGGSVENDLWFDAKLVKKQVKAPKVEVAENVIEPRAIDSDEDEEEDDMPRLQIKPVGKLDSVRTHAFGYVYTVAPKSVLDMTSKLQVVKLQDKIPMGPDKVDLDFMNAVLVTSKEAFQAMISGQLQRRKWVAKSAIELANFFAFLENKHKMVLSQEAREKCVSITRTGIVVEVNGNKYYVTLADEGKELVIQAKRA